MAFHLYKVDLYRQEKRRGRKLKLFDFQPLRLPVGLDLSSVRTWRQYKAVLYQNQALIYLTATNHNYFMKIDPNKENQDRAALIKEAIAASGKKKSAIALELDIKPQAITGWETTGRIHRTMLRKLGLVLGKNLCGEESTIEDLDEDTKQVVKLMEMTDNEGRVRARIAVTDILNQYKFNKRLSESSEPNIEEAINSIKDPQKRAVLKAALDTISSMEQDSVAKPLKKAS